MLFRSRDLGRTSCDEHLDKDAASLCYRLSERPLLPRVGHDSTINSHYSTQDAGQGKGGGDRSGTVHAWPMTPRPHQQQTPSQG